MTDVRPATPRLGRTAALAAIVALAFAVLVAAGPRADATRKSSTTVTIASIRAASGPLLVHGETAVIRGAASGNLTGARLVLQRKKDGRWIDTPTTAKVRADRTYRMRFTVRGMGTTRYRVRFDGTATKAASQRTTTATVWRWISLVPHRTDGNLVAGRADLDGWHYPWVLRARGIDGGAADGGTIALSRRCDRVTTVIGVDDASDPGFLADFSMTLDGREVLGGVRMGTGASAVVSLKTARVAELGLAAAYPAVTGTQRGWSVWARTQGLCKAYPAT
ncbi:hypothetical protein [Demequina maris]|uniref:hypothetical protein n=1 Tax=Demequina maris TaxID=1638982 RepID=UPI00078558F6|nr:hypothetical protein [Demequina maris]